MTLKEFKQIETFVKNITEKQGYVYWFFNNPKGFNDRNELVIFKNENKFLGEKDVKIFIYHENFIKSFIIPKKSNWKFTSKSKNPQIHINIGLMTIFSYTPPKEVINNTTELEKFNKRFEQTLNRLNELVLVKGKEYMRNNDPFHNFRKGAKLEHKTPLEILNGMRLKHLISIDDIKEDFEKGLPVNSSQVEEKYNDILIYYIIEKLYILNYVDNIK